MDQSVTKEPSLICIIDLQVLQKYYPGGFFGEDKKGHPVYYDFYGNMDITGKSIK